MCLTKQDLIRIKQEIETSYTNIKKRVVLCGGTGCLANGGDKIYKEFVKLLKEQGLSVTVDLQKEDKNNDVSIAQSGCQGFCQMGPLVTILPDEILT